MPELGLGFQAMDSPETTKLTTISTASDSPPIQDSPFSNFISNLSPIIQVRNTRIVRELSRLNSPPIVFKSPRTKQHNETNILKRSESLQLSRLETSESLNAGKESSDRLADAEKSGAAFQSGLIAETETQKGCHVVESSETRPSSSSGCVDGFLADLEADCVNSAKSATPVPKQSDNAPKSDQTGSNGSKRTILQFDGQNGTWMDAERSLDAILFSSEQTENGIGLNTSLNEIEAEQHDDERLFGCQDINTSFPGGHAFTIQASQVSQVQVIENEHQSDPGCGSQPSAESFPEQTFGGHSKDVGGLSHKLVENTMLNGHKASENQRGVRRRCLQFEEVPLRSTGHSSASLNLVNNVNIMKESKSRHVESKESSESKMADLTQSGATLMRSRSSENISMASKPVGIGLHLNSVVVAASQRSPTTAQKQSTNQCIGVQGMGLRKLESTNSCSISLSVTPKDSALDETGKSNSQTADGFEDLDPSSPQKKRKKATGSDGADGCKRCSCKKTKCLKLYCDCFAAGVYCSGPCACQGCFNRPEYEDTVRETRKQIESRNPLAFAPKVVQRTSELPPNYGEAGNGSTPSSARHKRGCNCKRSMCLKKYCECYQANVGCSSGCRCEGCKNVYGRKEESAAMEYVISREVMVNKVCKKVIESTSDKPSEMVEIKRDQPCAESNNTNHLTPQTSSFQHSDPGKAAPKSRFLSERYLPSPDSDISVMSSYEKPTTFCPRPRDALSHGGMVSETCEGSKDRQADYNQGRLGSVSSICDSVSETLMPTLSTSSRTRDCISIAQNRKCPESHDPSSRSFTRHGSPLTPTTRVGGTKPRDGLDSGCELVDILEDNETPMRVSSPNKKRVSPPHSHIYKLGSGSSGTLKSGRKFILRSVPSFPPLTPFIESKGSNTSQSPNKLEDNSIKN